MADDPTPLQRAEDAVCDQIVSRAASQSANEQRAGELKKLAEAVGAMKHGPQGGNYNYDGSYVSTTLTDAHSTDHQGENRSRPPAGFGGGSGG